MTKILLLVIFILAILAIVVCAYRRAKNSKGDNALAKILGKPRLHP